MPPVRPRHRPEERGIALLLVFLLVLILIPFAGEFAYQVRLEASAAKNTTDQTVIENLIDGQFEIVLSRLRRDAMEETKADSWHDDWNAQELRERRESDMEVALTTRVFDEQGKFNLKLLAQGSEEKKKVYRDRLKRLLLEYRRNTSFELSEGDAEGWVERISDYVTGERGANLPSPKTVDQSPIHVLEELAFLDAPADRGLEWLLHDQRREEEVAPGLHRYVTVYGNGKLNLNTADVRVLRALFAKDPDLAERIVERREGQVEEGEGGSTPRPSEDDEEQGEEDAGNPFTEVSQLNEVEGITPQTLLENLVDPAADFDVRSNFFSVRIIGSTDVTRRDELFVVERVMAQQADQGVEGFRFHLHQERTDALEEIAAELP